MGTTPHYELKTYDFDQQDKNERIIDTMNTLHGSAPTSNLHVLDKILKEHEDALAGQSNQLEVLREEVESLPAGPFVPREEYEENMALIGEAKADYHKTQSELEWESWPPPERLRVINLLAADHPEDKEVLLYDAADNPEDRGDLQVWYNGKRGILRLNGAPDEYNHHPRVIALNATPVALEEEYKFIVGRRELGNYGRSQHSEGIWLQGIDERNNMFSLGLHQDTPGYSEGIGDSQGEALPGMWMFTLRFDEGNVYTSCFDNERYNLLVTAAPNEAVNWTWDDWEHDQAILDQSPPEPDRRSLMGVYDESKRAISNLQHQIDNLEPGGGDVSITYKGVNYPVLDDFGEILAAEQNSQDSRISLLEADAGDDVSITYRGINYPILDDFGTALATEQDNQDNRISLLEASARSGEEVTKAYVDEQVATCAPYEAYEKLIKLDAALYKSGSVAVGQQASAEGNVTTAFGFEASASEVGAMALGSSALANRHSATAIGRSALATHEEATALGCAAHAAGVQSTALGYCAHTADERAIVLGDSKVSSLSCSASLTTISDERDKIDIKRMHKGLEFINKISPIQYKRNPREKYINIEDLPEQEKEKYYKYGLCDYNRESHAKGELKGERNRVGVSAQQVIEALEEVYGTADYANIVNDNFHDYSPDAIPEGVENKLGVTYESFIPFLISAINELSAQVEALRKQVHTNHQGNG